MIRGDAWSANPPSTAGISRPWAVVVSDVERDLIRTRTAEGRSRAKARGQHMGRPPKLTPQQQKEARRRRAEGESPRTIARSYGVHRSTIERLAVTPQPNQHLTHETARNAAGAR